MFAKLKQFLPGSSRSLHAMHEDIKKIRDEIAYLYDRTEIADRGINMNIDYKFDTVLLPQIAEIKQAQAVKAEHDKLRFEALLKNAYPYEDPSQIRRRIFSLFPNAEGDLRLVQLANARLMNELDTICKENGIEYWLSYGSLIGVLARDGFIPWDDDIDICMMREDIERLIEICKTNDKYQVTIVYDWFVKCKQLRFSARNEKIPCFIDLSMYDWAIESNENDDTFRKLRIDFMQAVADKSDELQYWKENPYLFAVGSGSVVQCGPVDPLSQDTESTTQSAAVIEELFAAYNSTARRKGILCEQDRATGVAYSIENMFNAPKRRTIWPSNMIFPTTNHNFEAFQFKVPNKAFDVADSCYPGWPYLPDDILGHEHFSKEILKEPGVREALSNFVEMDSNS